MSLRREERQVKPSSYEALRRTCYAADWQKRSSGGSVYREYDGIVVEVRSVNLRSQKRVRAVAGWICLLAVTLMYAPLAGAVLIAHGMDCCTGGYCKIPAHHHKQRKQQTEEQQAPMPHSDGTNCGHQMGGMAMTACSMTCCQDPVRPALMPVAFVLPAAALAPEPSDVLRPVRAIAAAKISRLTTPLSPPPRSSSPAL